MRHQGQNCFFADKGGPYFEKNPDAYELPRLKRKRQVPRSQEGGFFKALFQSTFSKRRCWRSQLSSFNSNRSVRSATPSSDCHLHIVRKGHVLVLMESHFQPRRKRREPEQNSEAAKHLEDSPQPLILRKRCWRRSLMNMSELSTGEATSRPDPASKAPVRSSWMPACSSRRHKGSEASSSRLCDQHRTSWCRNIEL